MSFAAWSHKGHHISLPIIRLNGRPFIRPSVPVTGLLESGVPWMLHLAVNSRIVIIVVSLAYYGDVTLRCLITFKAPV